VGPSRTLLVPGLRTAPRAGWRSGVGSAVAIVVAQPSLWLLGALGFAARGGIVLLALPIVIVPTPIQVRALLGTGIGSSGLTASFYAALPALAAAGLLIVLGALLLAAQSELSSFERLVADPESAELRHDHAPRAVRGGERHRLLGWLFLVQLGACGVLAVAAIPLALSIGDVALQELLRPTAGASPLYLRILYGVREPLFLVLPALVLVEIASAGLSRRVLRRAFGLTPDTERARGVPGALAQALAHPLRHPLRSVGTAVLAWAASLGVLLPVVWAIDVAWDATRAAYLAPRATTDPQLVPGLLLMTGLFVGVWVAAVLLAGFVSALRAGLWSVEGLR